MPFNKRQVKIICNLFLLFCPNIDRSILIRERTLSIVGGGQARRVLQIFQNKFRSPGGHRPKYFMAQ